MMNRSTFQKDYEARTGHSIHQLKDALFNLTCALIIHAETIEPVQYSRDVAYLAVFYNCYLKEEDGGS